MQNTIGASVICMDHLNFERELDFLEKEGVDYLHLDVMDGNFVPRFGIYPEIAEEISLKYNMPMDLHIMTENPVFCFKQFKHIKNIEYVSVHYNGNKQEFNSISNCIRSEGKKVGVVVDLLTNTTEISKLIKFGVVDSIMLMGIMPGVLTQTHRPDLVMFNVSQIFEQISDLNNFFIQVDGAVNWDSIPDFLNVGINNFVCGTSTLFKGRDPNATWEHNKATFVKNINNLKHLMSK